MLTNNSHTKVLNMARSQHPGTFIEFSKVSILPDEQKSAPLPVKYKQIFPYDDTDEEFLKQIRAENLESEQNVQYSNQDKPDHGRRFFMDPLCPPDEIVKVTDLQEDLSNFKLGHNMRASKGGGRWVSQKDTMRLMEQKTALLLKQKEQLDSLNQQMESDQSAAKLVNDLLQLGFQVAPPDETPRNLKPPSFTCDEQPQQPTKNREFLHAVHTELKRVHGKKIK